MRTHALQLATKPFTDISGGNKVIESRLYDQKRQLIELGDTIVFTNRHQPDQTITVEVTGLLVYKTFYDLFNSNLPNKFGGPNVAWLLDQIHKFYSLADEAQNGVVGIQFKVI